MQFNANSAFSDPFQCDELLNRLEGLPLAISQAGAFLKESGMKVEDYIESYDRKFEILVNNEPAEQLLQYHGSIWTTWVISFDEIRRKKDDGMAAANLLVLWSCLDNKDLWYELFSGATFGQHKGTLPSWMMHIASDQLNFSKAMRLLRRYSLIEEVNELGSYSIHPVVHKWAYYYFYDDICKTMGCTAIILLGATVEKILSSSDMEALDRILPHVQSCVERSSEKERGQVHDSGDKGKLENDHVREIAYLLALSLLTDVCRSFVPLNAAFEGDEKVFQGSDETPSSSDTRKQKLDLLKGIGYQGQFRLEEATQLVEQAFEGLRESPDSVSRLKAMKFLGEFYLYQGRTGDARRIITTAREECESKLDSINPLRFELLFSQAVLCLAEDELDEATATMESARQQIEEKLGPTHELNRIAMNRLGFLYAITDQRKGLRKLRNRVFHMKNSLNVDIILRLTALVVPEGKLAEAYKVYKETQNASGARKDGDNLGNGLASYFMILSRKLAAEERDVPDIEDECKSLCGAMKAFF